MKSYRVPLLYRLAIAFACVALLFVPDSEAEAQFGGGGFSVKSRRVLPGPKIFSPRIRTPNRRVVVPGRRSNGVRIKGVRRPDRTPPRIKTGRRPAPPCGRPGTRPCAGTSRPSGQIARPTLPRRPTCRPGSRVRNCIGTTPPDRGGPTIVLPPFGPGDGGNYLSSLGHRQERVPSGGAATSSPTTARQILVLVAQSQPGNVEAQIATAHRLQLVSGSPIPLLEARAQVYRINDQRPIQAVITALQADPRVVLVQRNMLYQRQASDGNSAIRAAQYGLDMIGVPRAHELATGRGVKIAVIDTGIDADHPDLKDAVTEAFDATGSKDGGPDAHGTAVAGIIRARGSMSGVAPAATLLAARAFYTEPKRPGPESTSFILLKALDWSVSRGANVINLSFAGGRDPALERVVAAAAQRNVILVAAAGNGGPKAAPAYPAAYPQVIAVTAHDRADKLYVYANRGNYIAVAAPGVDILVPILKGGHMFMSGTSMASAYVTGIVALMLERSPQLGPERAARILADTAGDLGKPGRDSEFGAGRVDAPAALEMILGRAKEIGARQ